MEAGFVYDCSSGKYPIFIFFIRKYLTSDYLIFFKNHGNCIGILLKSRIFYYFNIVFLQNLSHSLRVLLQKVGQKVCENIGDVFRGIHSPVSKPSNSRAKGYFNPKSMNAIS